MPGTFVLCFKNPRQVAKKQSLPEEDQEHLLKVSGQPDGQQQKYRLSKEIPDFFRKKDWTRWFHNVPESPTLFLSNPATSIIQKIDASSTKRRQKPGPRNNSSKNAAMVWGCPLSRQPVLVFMGPNIQDSGFIFIQCNEPWVINDFCCENMSLSLEIETFF